MALYYNLTQLIATSNDDEEWLRAEVAYHVQLVGVKVPKLEQAVRKKKYDKVEKHVRSLLPTLVLFDLLDSIHLAEALLHWVAKTGKKSEGKAIFEPFQVSLNKTVKELKRDFSIL